VWALADALIAALARGLDATVVTRNRPDYARQGASVLTYS
jgi:predicted nucleic acid-binding protein